MSSRNNGPPDASDPRCFDGGLVGGPTFLLPLDQSQYRRTESELLCCNRLFCPSCKSWVRHVDGVRLSGWMSAANRQELYDAPYPENTKYVGPGGAGTSFRTYFCRCSAQNLAGVETVDLTDYGWTCGGHPQS